MPSKNQVNATLARLTGYHLTKGTPGAGLRAVQGRLARTERELERTRRERTQLASALAQNAETLARLQGRQPPAKPAAGLVLPRDYDDAAQQIIRACNKYSMTGHQKMYGLILATRYIVRNNIPGDIVECGVWRGGSMFATARTLLESNDTSRDLYLFDTFEGMTAPSEHDVRVDGKAAADLLARQDKTTNVWAVASLEDVQAGFADVPYPKDKVHYVVGKVEDTIPAELPEQISILRLDTDWYESTKHELDHAFERLSPGGILIIDDYGHWAGSRKATDEFVAALGQPLMLHRMHDGRIGVKAY